MYPVCSLNTINISIMYCLFLRSYVFFIFPLFVFLHDTRSTYWCLPLPVTPLYSTFGTQCRMYSRVLFCAGSFYDDSLLRRPLSSRTEHSRLVVHHCRNSNVLSLLRALLVIFRCACVSSFSILVQFY